MRDEVFLQISARIYMLLSTSINRKKKYRAYRKSHKKFNGLIENEFKNFLRKKEEDRERVTTLPGYAIFA